MKMKFRLKTTVGNETSSVFITKEDAVVVAGDKILKAIELVEAKGGEAECVVTKTMKIEIMKF